MKLRNIKLLILPLLILIPKIGTSGAYYSSQAMVSNNSLSAGCWEAPSVPVLLYPADNSYSDSTWNNDPKMDWENSNTSCPLSTTLQYQYESYTNSSLTVLAYQSGWLNDSFIPAPGTPENTYYWRVRARDSHGNESGFSLPWKFTVDRTLPTSTITFPFNSNDDNRVQYTYVWNGKVEGTASDNLSGVDRVEISIYRSILNLYWNGSAWVHGFEVDNHILATGTTNWLYQFNNRPPYGRFLIISHAIDKAGNVENSALVEFENLEMPNPTIETALISNRHYYSFAVNNTTEFSSLSYEITYDTNTATQGITGSEELHNQNIFIKDNILLGSQSSGGAIAFADGVKNIKITVVLTRPDGTIFTIEKTDE